MSRSPDILIAEDDPVIRRAVKAALKSEGYSVRETPDGAAALKAFGEKRPDLVLLDVMMPNTDGFETCRRIRSADAMVPIIFLTARSSEDDKVKGLGLGADDYIVKPFGVRELLARVTAVLRRIEARTPETIPLGSSRIDPRRAVLTRPDGSETSLTARELRLLLLFAARPGEPWHHPHARPARLRLAEETRPGRHTPRLGPFARLPLPAVIHHKRESHRPGGNGGGGRVCRM